MKELKKKRLSAIIIDFFIACFIVWLMETIIALIVEPIPPFSLFSSVCAIHFSMYWLFCKDCYKGMSPGKHIMGIQIIDMKTLSIASPWKCIIRDLCYFISFIEFIIFFASPEGLRIGDYLTSTRVVRKDYNLRQKNKPAIFIFIGFFVIWIIGCIVFYTRLGNA